MTGVAPRKCLGYPGHVCDRRVMGRSRCSVCDAENERLREQKRAGTRDTANPWRWVYRDRRWPVARLDCFYRDGFACVDCGHVDYTGRTLQADHDPALQDRVGEIDPFDLDGLATRCSGPGTRNCHAKADGRRRRARRERRAHE